MHARHSIRPTCVRHLHVGSTGLPKGVNVPHAGVVNLLHSARERGYPSAPTRYGVSANYVFDLFQFGLFTPLTSFCGTCVLLVDSAALVSLVNSELGVTCIDDVPSVLSVARLSQWVEWVEVGGEGREAPVGLCHRAHVTRLCACLKLGRPVAPSLTEV